MSEVWLSVCWYLLLSFVQLIMLGTDTNIISIKQLRYICPFPTGVPGSIAHSCDRSWVGKDRSGCQCMQPPVWNIPGNSCHQLWSSQASARLAEATAADLQPCNRDQQSGFLRLRCVDASCSVICSCTENLVEIGILCLVSDMLIINYIYLLYLPLFSDFWDSAGLFDCNSNPWATRSLYQTLHLQLYMTVFMLPPEIGSLSTSPKHQQQVLRLACQHRQKFHCHLAGLVHEEVLTVSHELHQLRGRAAQNGSTNGKSSNQ